jgi:hypothetical protein
VSWKQLACIGVLALIVIEAPVTAGHFISDVVSSLQVFLHSLFHNG